MTTSTRREDAIAGAIQRLDDAQDRRTPCPPVRDLLPAADLGAAYAVQSGVIVLSGALGPMVPVTRGSQFTATITGVGSVSACFTALADITGITR